MNIFTRIRKALFPTRDERFQEGIDFAKQQFGDDPCDDEIDAFLDAHWLDPGSAFDDGIRHYIRALWRRPE